MSATRPEAATALASPAHWCAAAFGIAIEGSFEAPGLRPGDVPADAPRTRVEIVEAGEIERRWAPGRATRLLEERFGDDPVAARSIDHLAGAGYRLYARHFGLAWVDEDGGRVLCAPPADEPWSWQRFLVGRTLPWTAVLLGREIFHAGAVAIGGRAFALIGASGAGKSSLVAQLLLRGAGFVSDDVLAIGEDLLAHPGSGILCMRHAERAAMGGAALARVGRLLGDSGKLYVEVEREPGPLPLGGFYFVARGERGGPAIEPLQAPDFRLLLGSTFNESIQSPARLRRQFELCAELAARVPMATVNVRPGVTAAALAEAVHAHAEALS